MAARAAGLDFAALVWRILELSMPQQRAMTDSMMTEEAC
jgi:hypothetical protein